MNRDKFFFILGTAYVIIGITFNFFTTIIIIQDGIHTYIMIATFGALLTLGCGIFLMLRTKNRLKEKVITDE